MTKDSLNAVFQQNPRSLDTEEPNCPGLGPRDSNADVNQRMQDSRDEEGKENERVSRNNAALAQP